jgi:hypothetical protein
MAVARCDDSSPYGMTCPQCNDLMIAPSRSVYVSRNSALHCWSCDTCGHDAEIFDRLVQPSGVETAFWGLQSEGVPRRVGRWPLRAGLPTWISAQTDDGQWRQQPIA